MEYIATCQPFTGEPPKEHRLLVDTTGIYVYDSVAGYYTSCHRLTHEDLKNLKSVIIIDPNEEN